MNKKRRIFIGYALSAGLQEAILEWSSQFSDLPVRWIAPENLHVTLVPPWYEQDVEGVILRLQQMSLSIAPFPISFEKVTFGPDPKKPRLLWAKGKTPQEFIMLKNQVIEVLQQREEKRTTVIHTTIARFRPEQFARIPSKKFLEEVNWQEMLAAITVFESHLYRTGAVYSKLAEISLR